MMSRRPTGSPSTTTNCLHRTGTGAAAEQEPMMIHTHRDDDDGRMRRRPVVHLQPNVIARLMGIDAAAAAVVPTPPPPKPFASGIVQFQAHPRRHTNNRSLHLLPYHHSSRGRNADDDAEYPGSSSRICLHKMMVAVPRSRSRSSSRRRHPQEEEEELLQKMRQDLQAWQASMMAPALQTSGARLLSDSDGGGRSSSSLVLQAIAQEYLRKQKMARYGFGLHLGLDQTKVTQQDELPLISNKNGSMTRSEGDHERAAAEPAAMPDDSVVVVTAPSHYPTSGAGAAAEPATQSHDLPSHGHTPIVLLKPATTCSESDTTNTTGGVAIGGGQKTKALLLGLPKLHRDANMSMLLQEVKDRVQIELTVTAATATDGGGELSNTKAPASAWAIPPLQQVTKEDHGNKRRLFRSQSFRAFRRDRKRNASPEAHILKSHTVESPNKADDEESVVDPSLSVVGVTDGQSFRSECLTTRHRDDDASPASPSPRLLLRSFSAPEPGFAFSLGRLFSFKQHEASDEPAAAAAAVRMTSKSVVSAGFSSFIRGTVSSLRRHGFSSRRKLMMFSRKTHWSTWSNKTASLGAAEIHPAKMDTSSVCAATTPPPSHETFNLFKVAQASLSELPPSPVSPLEVAAGHISRHFFTDLHFTLPPELSPKCLSEFEAPATASESSFRTDITSVKAAWSRDKAYITELLIASGLYEGDNDNESNARVDSMARPMPICDDVFEDMYCYRGDYIIAAGGGMYGDGTDHRMLFDLANEALQSLVVESSRGGGASSLRQWVVDSTGVARGKKLVDGVWHKMQALRSPQQAQEEMQTIDGMAAYDVRRSVWAEVLYEDVYVVGRKIERAIFDELIEDLFARAGG